MPKRLTKTQIKRLYRDILSKSRKLWYAYGRDSAGFSQFMSTKDYMAIEAIISKYQKKMR